MLRNIADNIKYCLDRAAKARDQANQTADPVQKTEFLHAELGWLRSARSYELADSLENFLHKPRSTATAVWRQRILNAYESLVKDAHEECGDQRTASLVHHGPYEVRLVELSCSLPAEGTEHLWLELFDHHHKRAFDSSSGSRLEDLLAAAESLCSKAKDLSLEVTSGPPIIAIIDDDPDILEALDLMLSSHGYRSEPFASAEDFLDTAATSEVTCLVVDIQLGGMSGVELGRQLSASGFTFPIIFMTGSRDELHRRQAMDCGCVAFLLKPFRADRVIEAVASAIGSKRN